MWTFLTSPQYTECLVSHTETSEEIVENQRNILECPGNSPDLNPTEMLWSVYKQWLCGTDCTTMEKIQALIQVCTETQDPVRPLKVGGFHSKSPSDASRVEEVTPCTDGRIWILLIIKSWTKWFCCFLKCKNKLYVWFISDVFLFLCSVKCE